MDQDLHKLGQMFEFFFTIGAKNLDQDQILQAIQQPIKRELTILTMYPSPLERSMNPILNELPMWCFHNGLKVIREGDPKFSKIEEFYNEEDANIAAISEVNYFVVNEFKGQIKYYCTSAIYYDKMFLIDDCNDERLIQVYIPKAFCVASQFAAFVPQRQFLVQLLKIQKLRQNKDNKDRDKIIEIRRHNKIYMIEEIKLYDFYIRTAVTQCPIYQGSLEYKLKFSSSEVWINYYQRNSRSENHYSIFYLSNNLFDVLIFNQPLYNIFKLHLYMLHEYQIIIVSKKQAGITLFCQSMLELLRPLEWKGLYIPYIRPGTFDFLRSKIPYLIGLDRNNYEIEYRRVIYDIDDGRIVSKSDDPKCPKMHQNYLLRKLNTVFAELKFYENEYFEEGILRYRQCFYNFLLLLLNDIYKYYQKNETNETENEKKVVYFDFRKFLASFDESDQPFFLQFMKTLTFQTFVKELYKAMEYRDDYIENNSKKQIDYSFPAVLQFFDDIRFLSIRFGEQTLDDKFTMLENLQVKYITDVLERGSANSKVRVIEKVTTDFIPDYLEKGSSLNLSTEIKQYAVREVEDLEDINEKQQEESVVGLDNKNSISSKRSFQKPNSKINEDKEPSIGGNGNHSRQQSLDALNKDFSQMSSKLSNGDASRIQQQLLQQQQQQQQQALKWEMTTLISSNLSHQRNQDKINHLSLFQKKNNFKQRNAIDEEEEEEDSDNDNDLDSAGKQREYLIVTNIAEKNNLLAPFEGNFSQAARSYFNKSMLPMMGDDQTPEIHDNRRDKNMI